MAHTALLKLGSKEYTVIECEYEFIQPVKDNGQPSGRPSCGLIHLIVVAPDNSDLDLHSWMQSATEHKEGQIVFSVMDTGVPSRKTLHFKRAYCIRLYEYFNGHSNGQMHTKLTLSAAEIAFGDTGSVVFKNDQK